MTSQFINHDADNWAKQNLAGRIEIKPLYNSLFARFVVGSAIGFLLLIFLGIPAMIVYGSIVRYAAQGWTSEVSRGFTFAGVFVLAVIVFAAVIIFYLWKLRADQVIAVSGDGIFTRSGKKYDWKDLQYVKFKQVDTAVRGDFYLRFMAKMMYRSVQKIQVEMFFANSATPAVVPPLIAAQNEILSLLKSIPAERRVE